jgi:hypothetical protein
MNIQEIKFSLPDELIKRIEQLPVVAPRIDKYYPTFKQLTRLINMGYFKNKIFQTFKMPDGTVVSKDQIDDITHRLTIWRTANPGKPAMFVQSQLPMELQQQLISHLPESLQKLKVMVTIQAKLAGSYSLAPHRDHYRTATIWYLLSGNNETTTFWEETEPFEQYPFISLGDISKLRITERYVLQERVWYMFNNAPWHSVEATEQPIRNRTTLCIEFTGISHTDLCKLYQESAVAQ